MNIWKLTYPATHGRSLVAIVAALTPVAARAMVLKSPSYELVVFNEQPDVCKQIGVAASDIRSPEIILIACY